MFVKRSISHTRCAHFSVDLILRLYEFMCVMSTIPTMNPSLTMTNMNTKSKTTIASGGGMGKLTQKSHRGQISPFKADK